VRASIFKAAKAIAFLVTLCVCLGCASPQPKEPSPAQPVLRVGVCANSPPIIFKQAGEYAGVEAELARGLGSALGMPIQFVECPWNDLIPALLDGKFDIIMSGMTITEQRSVRIAFTSPYLTAGQMCLVRNELRNSYPTTAAVRFTNMRVGTRKGTTGDFLVQQNLTLAKKESFTTPAKGAQALLDGKIDLFVDDASIIWWLAATYESKGITTLPFFLTREEIAWGVRKDNTMLLASANRFIEAWKQNGRLRALLTRWMPNAF
jgi:ABC-type amino acid transport substrate-binding protein